MRIGPNQTQDRMHREPAVALAEKGYHLLLEKPMSVSEEECEDIAREEIHVEAVQGDTEEFAKPPVVSCLLCHPVDI